MLNKPCDMRDKTKAKHRGTRREDKTRVCDQGLPKHHTHHYVAVITDKDYDEYGIGGGSIGKHITVGRPHLGTPKYQYPGTLEYIPYHTHTPLLHFLPPSPFSSTLYIPYV